MNSHLGVLENESKLISEVSKISFVNRIHILKRNKIKAEYVVAHTCHLWVKRLCEDNVR